MIEYKYNNDISLYFTPLENGKAEYRIQLHDFANFDCIKETVSYECLQDMIRNPNDFLFGYRNAYAHKRT